MMLKLNLKPTVIVLLLISICYQATAQSGDINHFYFGSRLGVAKSMEISERGNTAKLANNGLGGTYIFGYKLNQAWSLEIGVTVLEDFNLGIFLSDNDINISGRSLAANYTRFVNDGRFFVRGRGGLIDWEAEAAERSILFGIDLAPEDPAGPYRNSGLAPLVGVEFGIEFIPWLEWTILGFDKVPSGDAQWYTIHTGLKFSF